VGAVLEEDAGLRLIGVMPAGSKTTKPAASTFAPIALCIVRSFPGLLRELVVSALTASPSARVRGALHDGREEGEQLGER
jgi:hypothetical protein